MANKPRTDERDRRARVEAMRREHAARERRKSMLFIGGSVLVGLLLIGLVAVPAFLESRNDPLKKNLNAFGVSASDAKCDAPVTDPLVKGNHLPDGTKVKYAQTPPTSGDHWNPPVQNPLEFYTKSDRPEIEQLVHNLEHGHTIMWYDATVKDEQLEALQDIAKRARTEPGTRGKFIVSAWDDAYGKFPSGKHVALSHWGAKEGYRQLCGQVSGEVVASFVKKYPASNAPEPNAA